MACQYGRDGLPYASRVMQETVEGDLMPVMHALVMTFISRRLSVLPDTWQTIEMNGLEH